MKYDITKQASSMMPYLGKSTECIKLLVSQISPDMREVIVPMLSLLWGLTSAKRSLCILTMRGRGLSNSWRIFIIILVDSQYAYFQAFKYFIAQYRTTSSQNV
jgi:hypothetical protein